MQEPERGALFQKCFQNLCEYKGLKNKDTKIYPNALSSYIKVMVLFHHSVWLPADVFDTLEQ